MIKIQNGEQKTKTMRIFIKKYDHLGTIIVERIGTNNEMHSYYHYKPFSIAKSRLGMQETPRLLQAKSTPLCQT
jgi:hypothetical protein